MMRYVATIEVEASSEQSARAMAQAACESLHSYKVSARFLDLKATSDKVVIYTDGGCNRRRNGAGAWAYVALYPDGSTQEASGGEIETTNNRMELMAVISALEDSEIGPPIQVYSDSEYVVKGLTAWVPRWLKNGWKTREGKDVVNQDLWARLVDLYSSHTADISWVKGHAGTWGNDRADALCTEKMQEIYKEELSTTYQESRSA